MRKVKKYHLLFSVVSTMFLFTGFASTGSRIDFKDSVRSCLLTGCEYFIYNSYSQLNNNHKSMKAGYPVFTSVTPAFRLGYLKSTHKLSHEFIFFGTLKSNLSSDNGTGINFLLNEKASAYSRNSLDYNLWLYALKKKSVNVSYAVSAGILNESRKLVFNSGVTESTRDFNFYISTGLRTTLVPVNRWVTEGTLMMRFFVPWLNYGIKLKSYPENSDSFRSPYHSLMYKTMFTVKTGYVIKKDCMIYLGFSKDDLIGYGSPIPSYNPESIIHNKIDRMYRFFIHLDIPL